MSCYPKESIRPLLLLPQRIELPHRMELPHKIELLPSTEEPLTMTTFPSLSTIAVGDKALPAAEGARSVFANAASISRYPAPTVKMSACSLKVWPVT